MKPNEYFSRCGDQFNEMKALADKQKALLSEDRIDLFLRVGAEREKLRQKISTLERRYKRSSGEYPPLPFEGKNRSRAEEMARTIRSIQDIDREIVALLHEKRGRLLTEIRGLRHGQKALKGYGGKSPLQARFIDKQG